MPKYRLAVALASAATIGICLMVLVQPNQTFFSLKGTQQLNVKKSSSTKPNFVFIYADDLAWNSIGYEDYDLQFTTPHLTSMAEKGIRMTNYYAQEVCNPSRASLLTGRYPASVGMQYGVIQYYDPWGLSLDETLLPEILKDEGYKTYMLGKWHLGHYSERMLPTARGFDTFTGQLLSYGLPFKGFRTLNFLSTI
jgi:arylsulfatase A-like enzyme